MLLYGELGMFGPEKIENLLKLWNVCGSNAYDDKTIIPVGQKK